MLIATFGSTTGWAGKTISREGDAFILDGHGPITAADVMEYDRRGQLVWATEGTRGWVGSLSASRAQTPSVTLESDAAEKLQLARQQFVEGKPKKALATLHYVVPGARTDPALAEGLFELASEVRAANEGRLDDDCDEFISSAQAALAAHADRTDLTRVGRAKYLGGHAGLGPRREGWLWMTTEHIGLQELWVAGSMMNGDQ